MSSDKRLFVGLVTLRSGQSIANEIFIDFSTTEDAALGFWVSRAMGKNPGYAIISTAIEDATDFVREGLAT